MALLSVVIYPDDRLRAKNEPISDFSEKTQEIVDNMLETMYQEDGVGLAGPQVAINKQIVVIDVSDTRDQPIVLINPEITNKEGKDGIDEGCLSIPGFQGFVERAAEVDVKALDRNGKEFEFHATDLLAICVQHELDHLAGKLFIDYLSPLKRNRIKQKLTKYKRNLEEKA